MKKRPSPPRPRRGAELIIKSNVECSSHYPVELAPGVRVLGNANGFRWLSDFFRWYADQQSPDAPFVKADPTDHWHLEDKELVNQRLSDAFGLQIGGLTERHRARVLRQLGVSSRRRVTGSPVAHLVKFLPYIEVMHDWCDDPAQQEVVRELEALADSVSAVLGRLRAKSAQQPSSKSKPDTASGSPVQPAAGSGRKRNHR